MDTQCIYCLQQLDTEVPASNEHVLQASLGWDETVRCVCEPCNSTFGHTIDASLVAELEPFRVHFDVVNRAGNPAKGTAIPVSGSWEGKKVGYDQKGIVLPGNVIPTGDLEYRSFGEFDKNALERKLSTRKGETVHLEQTGAGREEGELETSTGLRFLSSPEAMRGVIKIAFNYLALVLDPTGHALIEKRYDSIRSFVRGTSNLTHDDFSTPVAIAQAEIPLHRILLVADEDLGVVHSLIMIFNIIGVYALLSDDYQGKNQYFGTVIDPTIRQAQQVINSDGQIADFLNSGRDLFQRGRGDPDALNRYKIRLVQDTIERLNETFQFVGINHQIRFQD